ncbi:hypothetical protein Tco_0613137 [Tanacetum coccineum]
MRTGSHVFCIVRCYLHFCLHRIEPAGDFWGANDEEVSEGGIPWVIVYGYDGLPIQPVAPLSPDYIPGPEDPQTPPVPQDEDEREPMFAQAHDPDYVPEPVYPVYIPLEDDHVFPSEEQPLPPVDSPTAESLGYITGRIPKMLIDGDSSGRHKPDPPGLFPPPEGSAAAIPPPSTDITIGARITHPASGFHIPSTRGKGIRGGRGVLAMTTPSPSPPFSLSPPSARECLARIASTQALIDGLTAALPSPPLPPPLYIPPPVDRRDDIPESEQPPRKSTVDAEERRQGIRDVGYGIRDTWIDPAEVVPEVAPMTVGEVNTRVTELAELHEHDTQDLYALLEMLKISRDRIDGEGGGLCFPRGLGSLDRIESDDPSGASDPS